MKTSEQLKQEISRLKSELQRAELSEGFVKRLEECKGTAGGAHKWRIRDWEVTNDVTPLYSMYSMSPIEHGARHEKARMDCFCGATVTYEEGR